MCSAHTFGGLLCQPKTIGYPMSWQSKYYEDINLHVRVSKTSETSMDYEVYEPIGFGESGTLLFKKPKPPSYISHEPTEDVEEGQSLVAGYIKWDGCSNNYFGREGCIHACSREDLTRLSTLFNRLFDWAMELLGEHSKEFLEPMPFPKRKG